MNKLLPNKLKILGWTSVISAATLTFFYFYYGLRITLPVLAVYSSYLETKFFTAFKTNFSEELILLLFIAGFSLIVFSKEKNETDCIKRARVKALIKMVKVMIIWFLFTTVFIFGNGFIALLIVNFILPFIIYLIFFYQIKTHETD